MPSQYFSRTYFHNNCKTNKLSKVSRSLVVLVPTPALQRNALYYPVAAAKLRGCRAGPDAEDTDTIAPIFQQIGCRANTGGTKGLSQRYLSRQGMDKHRRRAGRGAGPEGTDTSSAEELMSSFDRE